MDVLTKIKGLTYLGMGTLGRAFMYSLQRDRIERRFRSPEPEVPGDGLIGSLLAAQPAPSGADFDFEHARLEVRFLAADLVRMTWTPGELPVPYSIARDKWETVMAAVSNDDAGWRIASSEMTVTVALDGSVSYALGDKAPFRSERPPWRQGAGWVHQAELIPGERIHGSGMRAHGMDLRGGTFRLWNSEPKGSYDPGRDPLYVCVPVTMSLRDDGSSLVFYENPFRGTLSFVDHARAAFEGGALRLYVIPGPPDRALRRFTELVGRPAMPPRWAMGFHQCRWSYMNDEEVREVAEGFRSRKLPLSAIHLDIHYMVGHRVFTVDRQRFPDLGKLSGHLGAMGIRLVTILDPGVKVDEQSELYLEGLRRGLFCELPDGSLMKAQVWPGTCAFPDFTNPETRSWWADQYPRLLDKGIAGMWHDMNEPAAFAAWGDCSLPTPVRHDMEGRGGSHLEAHNLYALLEARAGFEGMIAHRPDRRPWILSRSGWVGLQRYAWHWTGDSESNWWSLAQTIRIVLSLGLTGIVYSGPDIGGFGGRPNSELFVRWFQLSTFLPFFRTHSAFFTQRREPWCFGDQALGIIGECLALRYRLMPYWYTLAFEAHRTGRPLVRPLFFDAPDPSGVPLVEDAFRVGSALLVAPVVQEGAVDRQVYLPEGTWYDFHTGKVFEGGSEVVVPAPLDRIPLFVQAGAILPVDEGGQSELHIWVPTRDGEAQGGWHYDDDGDGHGPWRLDRFRLERNGPVLEVTRESQGHRPAATVPVRLVLQGAEASRILCDGHEVGLQGRQAMIPGTFHELRIELG